MKRRTFTTFVKCMTPSGYWDNGMYREEGEVSFPMDHLKDTATVTKIRIKRGFKKSENSNGWKIFLDGQTTLVTENPLGR